MERPKLNGQQIIRRRLPAVERTISEINPEQDVRVRLMGTVLGMSASSLMLDDGRNRTEIVFDSPEALAGIETGKLVRVICRVLPLIDGFECRGEVIQNLDDFDLGLWKKAKEVISNVHSNA
ncbi:MAG: hypothetical protein QW751_01430 [Candidatus Aenigmatarchaeota archaeon]|nr:hypothetical protein [Candidatus Aenigmarchaeota archaeon]